MNCRIHPSGGRGWARAAMLLSLAGCLTILSACTSPRSARETSEHQAMRRGAPSWVGEPQGWAKLEHIDRWLQTEADRYDDYWRLQGELDLSEGRLAFARDEVGTAAASRSSWSGRVYAARAGFERVLKDPQASDAQLSRARHGLGELNELDGRSDVAQSSAPGGVLPRSSWRASRPIPSRLTRTSGGYDKITVHHTADLNGVLFDGSLRDSTQAVQRVQSEHMDGRAYGDIGYHFLIDASGRIYQGRDLIYQGAHAGGVRNQNNIGVCLLGNFETRRPTSQSLAALSKLLADLRREHRIRRNDVVCHRELKSTLCPGAHLASWTTDYRRTGPNLSSLGATSSPIAKNATAASYTPRKRSRSARSGGKATVR